MRARIFAALLVAILAAPAGAAGVDAGAAELRASAEVWLRVRGADGRVHVARLLKAGERYRLPAERGLLLDTGNARALALVHGDRPDRSLHLPGHSIVRAARRCPG
ncbi:MAG: DUF4115 domain-containing protein [Alphaproteobacteria bacterium]|nr:DUF4115 domain-containing protein [Alphaproteobacteria bacterium]